MDPSMNADHLRAFIALHLGTAPHERPAWTSFCREQRDRARLSVAVAAAALATAACGGDTTESGPDDETAGTGSAPTDDEATGGNASGGWEGIGGVLYGVPYETGGVSGGGTGGTGGPDSGGTGGLDSGGTGGLDSGGTGGLGLGGTVYGIGGLVELGGTGGLDSGGTGGLDSGGTGGLDSGGTGGLGLGGTLYGIGGIAELGGTGSTGGFGVAYGIPYESDCGDGYDDDDDGLVDCQDPDCGSECQGWRGCDATGAICSGLVLDGYMTANPDCQPATSTCNVLYPCGTSCPVPDTSQAVPPSGTEWEGCTEDGFAVCTELVLDSYFDARPQCAAATCGDGPYFPCAPLCGERDDNEYPAGSSDNWNGCRGSGVWVCTELANSEYFDNHPACIPNDTCAGSFFACNEICPPPTDAETP
jgi:hypothetical protein